MPAFRLPHLQVILHQTVLDPAPIFDYLTLPALHALSVNLKTNNTSRRRQPKYQMTSWPQAPFHALLSRSGCTLEMIQLGLHITEPGLFGVM